MMLAIDRDQVKWPDSDFPSVIHFAAEPLLERIFRKKWDRYSTADLYRKADLKLNVE